MPNNIRPKPAYVHHRQGVTGTDTTTLADLLTPTTIPASAVRRDLLDAGGWETLEGFVVFTAGAAPTVDIQVLEAADLPDGTTVFSIIGQIIIGLGEAQNFEVLSNGGRMFLRIDAIGGAPDSLDVYVSGGRLATREPGYRRR